MSSKANVMKKIALIMKLKNLKECEDKEKNICVKKSKIRRKYWVKPLLIKRSEFDIEAHLLKDLLWEDEDAGFNNFCRLSIVQYNKILNVVEKYIKKSDTHMRAAVTERTKLAVTLRYLATGDSYGSLEFLTRVSRSTISIFIPIVLRAICNALGNVYLKVPNTAEQWTHIAKDFDDIWQLPHVLGSLDGKHIRIKAPSNTGSQFYNFKGFFSVVLFAAVDAHCRFSFVNIGSNGKAADSTIYQDSFLYRSLENGSLNIPKNKQLVPGRGNQLPYFFIGDDAFPLDKHLMKPYSRSLKLNISQEIFNYRLCRARMVVECAFGRLAKRFGIYNRPIEVQTSTIDLIVMTTCILHNYLTKIRSNPVIITDITGEDSQATFSSIGSQELKTYKYACRIRDEISTYLMTDGNVDFQWKKINIQPATLHHM